MPTLKGQAGHAALGKGRGPGAGASGSSHGGLRKPPASLPWATGLKVVWSLLALAFLGTRRSQHFLILSTYFTYVWYPKALEVFGGQEGLVTFLVYPHGAPSVALVLC